MRGALAALVLVMGSVAPAVVGTAPAAAEPLPADGATSTTTRQLPRTGLEAEELDQGADGGAGWMAASAIAAGAVVLGGGLVLKRRVDREASHGPAA